MLHHLQEMSAFTQTDYQDATSPMALAHKEKQIWSEKPVDAPSSALTTMDVAGSSSHSFSFGAPPLPAVSTPQVAPGICEEPTICALPDPSLALPDPALALPNPALPDPALALADPAPALAVPPSEATLEGHDQVPHRIPHNLPPAHLTLAAGGSDILAPPFPPSLSPAAPYGSSSASSAAEAFATPGRREPLVLLADQPALSGRQSWPASANCVVRRTDGHMSYDLYDLEGSSSGQGSTDASYESSADGSCNEVGSATLDAVKPFASVVRPPGPGCSLARELLACAFCIL